VGLAAKSAKSTEKIEDENEDEDEDE